jgi:hypothetical protein
MDELSAVVDAYIECALWAGLDWSTNPEPLEDNYGPDDLADETVSAIRAEVADFVEGNRDALLDLNPDQVGHDFYLTRNYHGSGFWDRGLGDVGDVLTSSAHSFGESDLYVGNDGRLYVS